MDENRDEKRPGGARLAAAHIAHGAATGGVYGAALSAAAEAAPFLLKLAVALAILLIGLPLLIFSPCRAICSATRAPFPRMLPG